MLQGGSLFAKRVVDEIITWATHLDSPAFILVTGWNNSVLLNKSRHYSPCIQYVPPPPAEGSKRRKLASWCVSYVPIRKLPHSKEPGAPKFKNVDLDYTKKLTYHFDDDDDVLQLIRNSFDVDAWRDGHPESEQMEALPRLYTVDQRGFLQLVPSNTTNQYGALTVDDWEAMIACYLSMIKLLTKGSMQRVKSE